jgi:methionyl aminopeptidase
MIIHTDKQLAALMRIGKIVGETLKLMQDSVEPGMTTAELNHIGAEYLYEHDARPAPIITYDFPGETCISINDEAAHGIPGKRVIKRGDLVNIDVSAELGGIFADTGGTVAVPTVTNEGKRLMDITRLALDSTLNVVTAGKPLSLIGQTIDGIARRNGYSVIRQLGGHGVGYELHEEPRNVPNHFNRSARTLMQEGLVMTIEPFITRGSGRIVTLDDGWTIRTKERALACQYEHTVVITRGKPMLVTAVGVAAGR